MQFRRLGLLAVVLSFLEMLGSLADRRWGFHDRLQTAFTAATRQPSDEDLLWPHPDAPFAPGATHTQVLHLRVSPASDPTGEMADPALLPPGRRVIVLGESAAFGVGVPFDDAFATLLDGQLRPRGTRVVNAGQPGADPWQVMDAGAQLLARYAPSTFVVFTGNNVLVNWSPPQQPRANPRAIAVLRALTASRALATLEFVLLRGVFLAGRNTHGFHDHTERMGSAYALAHPLDEVPAFRPADWPAVQRRYLDRFALSLRTLIAQSRARHVGVVLVTMPYNYRLSPAWKHPQFEAYDPRHRDTVRALLHDAGNRVQVGDWTGALPLVDRALALDPGPPLLHYLRGQCLEGLGRMDEAEAAYRQSRDRMIGNLGSRLRVNDILRAVARETGVPLVDAAERFETYDHAHGHHFNEDLFIDDCHASALGHRVLADAIAPVL